MCPFCSYIRFSAICANAVRAAMKPQVKAEAIRAAEANVKVFKPKTACKKCFTFQTLLTSGDLFASSEKMTFSQTPEQNRIPEYSREHNHLVFYLIL